MPQIRMRDAGGVLRMITRIRMRDAGNVLRTLSRVRMRDAGGVLRTVWQYFSVAVDHTFVNGNSSGAAASGIVTTSSVTGTVQGGTGPFTYLWEYVSGEALIVPSTPTAAATTFSATVSDGVHDATYRLKVTDSLSNVVYSENVEAQLNWIDTR
jgi:hypothetical protein